MSDKKPIHEGYQPAEKDHQPQPVIPTVPPGAPVEGGYQPATGKGAPTPNPPPKKP